MCQDLNVGYSFVFFLSDFDSERPFAFDVSLLIQDFDSRVPSLATEDSGVLTTVNSVG